MKLSFPPGQVSWLNSVLIAIPCTALIFGACAGVEWVMVGRAFGSAVTICTVVGFFYCVFFIRLATKWWNDVDHK